jgi:hypothetical protein
MSVENKLACLLKKVGKSDIEIKRERIDIADY